MTSLAVGSGFAAASQVNGPHAWLGIVVGGGCAIGGALLYGYSICRRTRQHQDLDLLYSVNNVVIRGSYVPIIGGVLAFVFVLAAGSTDNYGWLYPVMLAVGGGVAVTVANYLWYQIHDSPHPPR